MNLSAAYLNKQQEWKQERVAIGTQNVAINLLRERMPIDLIARTTGLSVDQINQLQQRL